MIRFFVPGIPAPGGSKRGFVNRKTGRVIITDAAGQRNKDWRTAVVFAASGHFEKPLDGPLSVRFEFIFSRPKGHFRTGKHAKELRTSADPYPSKRPDSTKCVRSTEDAMTGIAWKDDAQIVEQVALKIYGDKPGAWITVAPMNSGPSAS